VSSRPGFEFVEGATSDLSFVARGPSLEAVFSAAAEALLAATLEDPESLRDELERSLVLEEPELDLLLLRFLNELVYLRDAEELLLRPRHLRVSGGALEGAEGVRLEAELVGERIDRARHRFGCEVKAATAHRLRVSRAGGGWEATVTLDV
jgi:SHS2 domain-containing protein